MPVNQKNLWLGIVFMCCVISHTALHAAITLEQSIDLKSAEYPETRITAMVADASGELVVLDKENGVMRKIGATGQQVIKLTGEKKVFRSAALSGLAMIDKDMMLVVNSDESSIAIISTEGEQLSRFGVKGSAYGEMSSPAGVAYSDNRRIYIADKNNSRISVFGADGVFIKAVGSDDLEKKHRLISPESVFLDAEENIYVFEKIDGGRVSIFKHDGKVIKVISGEKLAKVFGGVLDLTAIAIDGSDMLYLADNRSGRIFQLDWRKEERLFAFGSKGNGRAQFRDITALTILSNGRLAVADSGNNKIEIYKFDEIKIDKKERARLETVLHYLPIDMECIKAYRLDDGSAYCISRDAGVVKHVSGRGKFLNELKELKNVKAMAINGDELVTLDGDYFNVLTRDGVLKFGGNKFAGPGSGAGKLNDAEGVYIKDGKIYIADTGNRRIQIFTNDGIYLDKIDINKETGNSYFSEPTNLVVDRGGVIYVVDKGSNKVMVFSKEKEYLYSLGGVDSNLFTGVYDISMDIDNNLYVLCETKETRYSIQVYSGPRKSFSFGSYSESRLGIESPVNLSIARTNKTIIGVYDNEKNRLLNFSYLQVPSQVTGVRIKGSQENVEINWQPVPVSYIGGYNIFGSADGVDYAFVTQVYTNRAILERKKLENVRYYKVDAFSALGAQGMKSRGLIDHYWAGLELFNSGKFEEAVNLVAEAIESADTTADMYLLHGKGLMELKRAEQAVESFSAAALIKGYEVEGLSLKAGALMSADKYIEAKSVIDQMIKRSLASGETFVYCGKISIKMKDAIGAVTCLEAVAAEGSTNVEAIFLMGEAYLMLGLVDKGLEEFSRAMTVDDSDAKMRYRMANTLVGVGRYNEAVEHYKKAVELDVNYKQAALGLAETYFALKQYNQAKAIAITMAMQEGYGGKAQYLLGVIAVAEGNKADALLALTKAVRIDSKYTKAWLLLADVYQALNQSDKIHDALVNANNDVQGDFDAAYRLGEYEYKLNNFKEAAVSLERAITMGPDNVSAKLMLAKALFSLADYQQSFVYANDVISKDAGNIDALLLVSDITSKQGKIGKSIDYMQQVINKEPLVSAYHSMLAALYIENNLFDLAVTHLEKAVVLDKQATRPYLLMGDMQIKKHLFDDAIKSYDKLVSIDPSDSNKMLLDFAYSEKKKSLDFNMNAPKIVINGLRLNPVFSAAYKKYKNKAVGRVKVNNVSGTDYSNLRLSFSVKGYMDFPSAIEIPILKAGSVVEYELFAAFNNKVLEIDEDTGVQVEVALHYTAGGNTDAVKLVQPMTIYGKNAIVWDDLNMLGAFVTPRDDVIRDFVRRVINDNKPDSASLNNNLVSAMTLFNALTGHGIKYVVDPNNPFADVKGGQVDYVQFGRETLKIKSGDCDDLAVLMSAGLENLGIETAILDVPGHLLMMFNTGLPFSERGKISLQDDLLVIHKDKVWIPVEATMIGTSFSEAWAEGASKYHKYNIDKTLNIVEVSDAWKDYSPVTLRPSDYPINIPDKEKVSLLVAREKGILLEKSLDHLVRPYEIMASSSKKPEEALMQMAIIYAKYGLYDKANKVFDRVLELSPENSGVFNNRGNIHFSTADYIKAIEEYSYAEQLAVNDYGIKINLAMAYYQLGKLTESREKFNEARMINVEVDKQYASLSKLLLH